jgi:GT2 family glycosyltransferase
MAEIDISIVIVNFNTSKLLLECIAAIDRTTDTKRLEIIVVDNGSADDSVEKLKIKFPAVRLIINTENKGFGAANNQALKIMQGRYALLLNTDATLTPGAVSKLFDFMESHPDVGMACGQLLNTDGSKQNAFANFPSFLTLMVNESLLKRLLPQKFPSKYQTYDQPIPVDSCIGACMIVRKSAMDEVGFFDERYFFFFEETDWAHQFKTKGWKIFFVPAAKIFHAQGQSAGKNVIARQLFYYSRYQYYRKWHPRQYHAAMTLIFMRLMVNTLLNGIGFIATLGLDKGMRLKLSRYGQLLGWHFDGCPFPKLTSISSESASCER